MLKLSCLAAIAVIGAAHLSIASAQTPTNVATEKARPALSAGDVPLRPDNAAVLRAAHLSPAPDGKRPVVAEAKQPKIPAGKGASIPTNAAIASGRRDEPRIDASAARLAGLTLSNRPHAGPAADASAAAVRNTKLINLATDATARSVAAHAFVSLPTNAAPALRARSAAAQRKAMRNLPKSALVRQKAKSGRKSG
jgi:hypothetical protein